MVMMVMVVMVVGGAAVRGRFRACRHGDGAGLCVSEAMVKIWSCWCREMGVGKAGCRCCVGGWWAVGSDGMRENGAPGRSAGRYGSAWRWSRQSLSSDVGDGLKAAMSDVRNAHRVQREGSLAIARAMMFRRPDANRLAVSPKLILRCKSAEFNLNRVVLHTTFLDFEGMA
jgi:hypothetical protein